MAEYMSKDEIKALEAKLLRLGDEGEEGEEKVEALNELAKSLIRSEPVKAEEYARQALALAEKLGFKEGVAKSCRAIGASYMLRGDYDKALEYQLKALSIFAELADRKGVAKSYNDLGSIYTNKCDYHKALQYHREALALCEELDDKDGVASSYLNIANIHSIQSRHDEALGYYLESLKIADELGDKKVVAMIYGNIGLVYKNRGDFDKALEYCLKGLRLKQEAGERGAIAVSYLAIGAIHLDRGKHEEALEYLYKALGIFEEIGSKRNLANCYGNIGVIHKNQSNYEDALAYLLKTLRVFEEIGNRKGAATACNNIGLVYTGLKRYSEALEYLQRGLKLALQTGVTRQETYSYRYLSEMYAAQGDFEQALESHKKYSELREKIFSDESAAKIAQVQIKYETEQKEWEAELYRLKTEDLEAEITERKRAQEALLKAKEDWERTFDAVPDLITIMDGYFRIVRANKAMADRLGITPEECRGQTCFERIHGMNEPPSFCPHARLLKDGQEHIEEVYEERLGGDFLVTVSPLFDSQKQVIGSVHVARDITERKRTQEALAESEERYRTLQENIPVGIFRTSPQGEFLSANRALANMLGFKSDKEMVNVSVADVYVFPEHRQEYVKLMNEEGMVADFEAQLRRKDGSVFWGSVNARAVSGEEGQVVHFDGVLEDITGRKRISEQIKAALAEKEVLLKEIHHRVKNNLQVIESLLSLQAEHLKDEKALAIFKNSRSRIASMALVHEKLYQSHDLARIDFGAYIRDLTNSLFTSYALAPGTVTLGMDIEDVALDIDTSIPLALIINELVTNSLLHAFPQGRKGQISIGLHADDGNDLTLVFTDDGVGLPEAIDIHNTETLGLQLVTLLVKQLRGNIELDRSNGTRFNIRFVRIEEES